MRPIRDKKPTWKVKDSYFEEVAEDIYKDTQDVCQLKDLSVVIESETLPYCELCKVYFSSQEALKKHQTNNHMFKADLPTQNPWSVKSLYEYQYFICPECPFKIKSKQEFVYHAHENHNNAIDDFLNDVIDDSLDDVDCPWSLLSSIKKEDTKIEDDPMDLDYDYENDLGNEEEIDQDNNEENDEENNEPLESPSKEKKDKFDCKYCGKSYTSNTGMKYHVDRVHKKIVYKCDLCPAEFTWTSSLKLHVEKQHPGSINKCDHCSIEFLSQGNLKMHLLKVHPELCKKEEVVVVDEPNKCDLCRIQFLTKEDFNQHMKENHPDLWKEPDIEKPENDPIKDRNVCIYCGKWYPSNSGMRHHVRVVHEKKTLNCEVCPEVYTSITSLKRHMESRHPDHLKKCKECNVTLITKKQFTKHMQKFHPVINYLTEIPSQSNELDQLQQGNEDNYFSDYYDECEPNESSATDGENKFQCKYCRKVYVSASGLKYHVGSEHEKKTYPCDLCDQVFSWTSSLKDHKRKVHPESMNKCSICHMVLPSKEYLEMHNRESHPEVTIDQVVEHSIKATENPVIIKIHVEKHKCGPCGLEFLSKQELDDHRLKIHGDEVESTTTPEAFKENLYEIKVENSVLEASNGEFVKCDLCNEKFQATDGNNRLLKIHMESKHGGAKMSCDLCHKGTYYNKESLQKHIKAIHTCPQCDIVFKDTSSVKRHILVFHENKRPMKCDRCLKRFKTHEETEEHKKICDEKFLCLTCGKIFPRQCNLRQHIRNVHDKIRSVRCDQCGLGCLNNYSLKKHIQTVHQNIRPYQCEDCGHAFALPNQLKKHRDEVHAEIKNFQCKLCNMAFTREKSLKNHIITIHDPDSKQFKCDLCGKSFVEKIRLKNHIDVVHEKKMKFKCDHCGKEFGNGNNYRTHVKVVHEGFKGYQCHYCNKYLRTQGALKKHLQSEHDE